MSNPLYIDISAFQSASIDWNAYKQWSAQGDGVSRVALKSSEGVGFIDPHYRAYRAGAEAAGIDVIIHYHYARPELNSASAEAAWQREVVGNVRPQDVLMLDYEQGVAQANAEWALEWLSQQETNYAGKLPTIYASDNYIRTRLQDARLARFPLTLANWTFNPSARPACPLPWLHYTFLQYTDKATNIPGVPGAVDANVFLGGFSMNTIPTGWHEETVNGQVRLVAPNGHYAVLGFREWILSHNWDAGNEPLGEEYHADFVQLHNIPLGTGQVQLFRDNLLWYTPEHGIVQESELGLEIRAAYAEIAALKAQPPVPTPPNDTTALVAAINAIPDGIAPLVANALIEAKKL